MSWSGRTWRACEWMRLCIRWHCCASECTEKNSQSGWSAAAHCPAVEIRVQECQSHCAYSIHGKAADEYVEHFRAARVRILCQRESEGGPPALEPGKRTPAWRIPETSDLDVQRLRPGRQLVQRD